MALAAGARQLGVRIVENTKVTGVIRRDGRVAGVTTEHGDIEAEYVVAAPGMWGREFGALAGVAIPLQALAHYYVITEPIPGLPPGLPTIKTAPDYAYVKNEGAGLMVGFFEPGSYPWASRGIPVDAEFTRLPEDWDHLGPFYEQMMKRLPVLADTGIRLHFCGPESFTPDGLYHLGEAPGVRNLFVAAGFNSVGFLSGPGAGSVLADWIVDGRSPLDLPETDPRRVAPHETNRRFLEQRVTETLDLAYEIHWPYQQRSSARGLRRSPLHDRVTAAGAVFGELLGWERANWYAPPGVERGYEYSFGRQNWFGHSAAEHRAVREAVGHVRHLLVRQAPGAGPGRGSRAAAGQRGRRGGRAGPHRLHPVAELRAAGSRPTSPSPGSTRPGSWCSPAPPPWPATATGWSGTSARTSSPSSPTSARPWR